MDALRPCPDSALLAAFIDGTLGDYERTAVVSHLSECPQCRAVALTVAEFREVTASDAQWHMPVPQEPTPLGETRVRRWAREKTRAPALALAAAATLAAIAVPLLNLLPSWSATQAVATLVDAAEGQRPLEARVTGGFVYAAPPTTNQAYEPRTRGWQLISAAGRVRETYEADYTVPSRRAVGVAALLVGDLDDAVSSLSIAAAAAPDDSHAAADLAAAYYERAMRAARPDDLPAALSEVERAISLDGSLTEAWFNRALIITALGLRAEAAAAWHAYVERDSTSPWAEEARTRAQALSDTGKTPWDDLLKRLEAGDAAAADVAVRQHASRTSHFFETVLLPRWVDGVDDAARHAVIAQMRPIGDAFALVSGEHLHADVVASLAEPSNARSAEFIASHKAFLDAMKLMVAARFADATVALERVEPRLVALESPLALRAAVDAAAADSFSNRHGKAASALPTLRSIARSREHRNLVTRASWILGLAEFGRADFAASQRAYEEMLASADAAHDGETRVMANVLLANLHWVLGDTRRDWQHRVRAAQSLDDVVNVTTRSNFYISAAGDALAAEQYAAALLFQTALLAVGPIQNPIFEVQGRTQRALSLHRLGRRQTSETDLEFARQLLDTVSSPLIRERLKADMLGTESAVFERTDPRRAMAAAREALGLPAVEKDLTRQARLNLRLANAAKAAGDFGVAEAAVVAGVTAWEAFRDIATSDMAIGRSDSAWSLYETGANLAVRRGDVDRAYDYTERRRAGTTYERQAWGKRIVPLADLQAHLAVDTAVAVLTQIDDRLHVWIVRRDQFASSSIAMDRRAGSGLVTSHLHEIARGVASPEMSANLFDAVLRPVERALRGARTVVVVADAPYDRVAFAGLWDRRRDRYFVEDHGVVSAPSATAYAFAAGRGSERRNATPRRAAVVDPEQINPSDGRPATLSSDVNAIYSGQLRQGSAATSRAVTDDVAHRDVVHIAARVITSGEYPSLSRLVMADEPEQQHSGSVFAREIAHGTVGAELVALAGQPGAAGDLAASGSLGVARALLAAGVPTVVGSVVNTTTADLDRTWLNFHRHYATGTAAAESLRRAQLAALDESKRRTGSWATLTVFGSTQ